MACDASLRRLNVDWIDLYQMHHVDRRTPWDEIWEAMETLRAQGKIIYTGSSNFGGWHIASAQGAAHEHKLTGLVSEQSLYNLFKREVELEVIPAIQQYGLALLPWSPLLAGALAGAASAPAVHGDRRMARRNKAMADHSETLLAYQALCQQLGKPPAQVGLAWLLHQAAVTAPIVGPRSVDHLDTAVGAVDLRLSDDDLIRLDEIFPGHRPAPEDYAW
jgi:aryl-alcohol dehydrogenase-like predicted oxidoreductase